MVFRRVTPEAAFYSASCLLRSPDAISLWTARQRANGVLDNCRTTVAEDEQIWREREGLLRVPIDLDTYEPRTFYCRGSYLLESQLIVAGIIVPNRP